MARSPYPKSMSRALIPETSPRIAPCPGCGAPATVAHGPFCSQGCRDRDLLQWLSEGYRLPVKPSEEDDEGEGTAGLDSRA